MKIVMLADLYDERLQYQENLLGKYYAKHGHDVTIIAAAVKDTLDYCSDRYERGGSRQDYWDGTVKIIKLPYSLNILNRLKRFGGVCGILANEKPDLIFCHDIHLNLSDAVWYRRQHPGCRIVMDLHADYSNSAKNWLSLNILHKVIRKGFLYWYKRHIDRFFPVVPNSAIFLSEVYGIHRDKMELLPLGADTDVARKAMEEQAGVGIRHALSIPEDAIVIFTGGKLAPLKKTHLLLEAWIELDDPKIHILLVGDVGRGDGNYKQLLLDLAAGSPRVHFVGWIDGSDVYRYMDAADFAVFPASQSVLWQQALSMGLPLIVGAGTHLGGQNPAYMNLHDNMVILPFAEIRSDVIAREIRRMSSDRTTLKRMQAAALLTTGELLNYDVIVQQTLRQALERGS